jgi:hypothetical protein
MARSPRDRVTVDLRGIGDAVRSAAAARGLTIAALAREALVAAAGTEPLVIERLEGREAQPRRTTKLHLRMKWQESEALVANAGRLGLSYGEYVGRLVTGRSLPVPAADSAVDRAALRTSSDNLAALAGDINSLIRLISSAQGGEAAQLLAGRMRGLESDVRRHIDVASELVAKLEKGR